MRTLNNYILVNLDNENDRIVLKNGETLYIDNTFEPEKHSVVTGTVAAIPKWVRYSRKGNRLPWETNLEIKVGDRVVMYYLAVQNSLRPENKRFIKENGKTSIFITYNAIYAIINDTNNITPINGYIFGEPVPDPFFEKKVKQLEELGLKAVVLKDKSDKNVVFAKIVFIGEKNDTYYQPGLTDDGCDIKAGDIVVLKKIRDISAEYEYHAKIYNGKKLYRFQRHDILGIL